MDILGMFYFVVIVEFSGLSGSMQIVGPFDYMKHCERVRGEIIKQLPDATTKPCFKVRP